MTDSLMTPAQLAVHLQIPQTTIHQWRHKKVGPPWFRVGRHVRYRWSDVQEWLDGQVLKVRQPPPGPLDGSHIPELDRM